MAFDDATEIVKMVEDAERALGYAQLLDRFEKDYDLYTIKPYKATEGYESYTSSDPRNFFDKVDDGIDRADMQIQIKLTDDTKPKKREAATTGELFLLGALADIDRTLRNRGEAPLRQQLAWYICCRGWYIPRIIVNVQKEFTKFDPVLYDPFHTTWERGANGLIWVANRRKLTRAQIKSEYQVDIGTNDAELVDFWDEENNSVIINGDFVKKPTKHGANHCPVFVGKVGSMPSILTREFLPTLDQQGDSVWTSSRNLYEPSNRVVSTLMDMQKRATTGSVVYKTASGTKTIDGDPYAEFSVIPIQRAEELVPLELPQAPPETAAVLGVIEKDKQQSTLPYPLAYGGTTQALSGRALDTLAEGTKSVYSPRTSALEEAMTWFCEELLVQYATNGLPMTLKGFKDVKGKSPEYFEVKVKPKDIDPEWFVKVSVEPRMPRDREAEIMMSLAATQKRGPEDIPLLSKQSARENIMNLQNPDGEEQKALYEMGRALTLPSLVAEAYAKAGDKAGLNAYLFSLPPEIRAGITGEAPPSNGAGGQGEPGAQGLPPPEQLAQMLQEAVQHIQRLEAERQAQGLPPLQPAEQGAPVGPVAGVPTVR